MEAWLSLAFLSPFLLSFTNIVTKRVSDNLDEYTVAWGRNIFSLPILWIYLFYTGFPQVSPNFWLIVTIMLPLEVVLAILFFRAIKISPVSLIIPFTSFTPLFVGIGAFLLLGEKLTMQHVLAILLLIAGAYFMNIEKATRKNLLKPIMSLAKERGPLMILVVTVLWGINAPLGKIAINASSIEFYTAVFFTLFVLAFTPIFLRKSKSKIEGVKKELKPLFLIGLFNSLFILVGWAAISLGTVAVVNALGGLNTLFTVILSGAFLKEKKIKTRLIASGLMALGAILIIIGS